MKLLEFFSYASLVSNRINTEYIPMLKKEEDKLLKFKKIDLMKEMKSMCEIYSSYQLEYDYYDYKNSSIFSLFIVIIYNVKLYRKTLKTKLKT